MNEAPPSELLEPLAGRLASIRARIDEACRRSGRGAQDVTLVGATKTRPAPVLQAAWNAGLHVFGENRVQEALAKSRELATGPGAGPEWHLIGPLQSNKVKQALELFRTIHSIDRPDIAFALEREAGRRSIALTGFVEVNLGGEESKHGFPLAGFAAAVRPLADLEHLKIAGLMAIPPPGDDAQASRPWFRRLRELRDDLAARPEWAGFPGLLSMGMSDDFEVGIEEGATHVRVGTALFGHRG